MPPGARSGFSEAGALSLQADCIAGLIQPTGKWQQAPVSRCVSCGGAGQPGCARECFRRGSKGAGSRAASLSDISGPRFATQHVLFLAEHEDSSGDGPLLKVLFCVPTESKLR